MRLFWLLLALGACGEALEWSRDKSLDAETWASAPREWRSWLTDKISGYGYGDGYGYGYGDGYGYGYGYGSGYGDGYGYGYGEGYGYGYGEGYGYGDGDGYGEGSGYGDGSGDGYGDIVALELSDGTLLSGDLAQRAVLEICTAAELAGINLGGRS